MKRITHKAMLISKCKSQARGKLTFLKLSFTKFCLIKAMQVEKYLFQDLDLPS
jgi:hypothetical protein